ncbi:MAG: transcriptional regulator of acetoin/glycerol metabolism, partial [Gammaproteobacteria bacterium]
ALKLSRGNLSEAARLLGVNRTTLYSKIQRLSLGVGDDERG